MGGAQRRTWDAASDKPSPPLKKEVAFFRASPDITGVEGLTERARAGLAWLDALTVLQNSEFLNGDYSGGIDKAFSLRFF